MVTPSAVKTSIARTNGRSRADRFVHPQLRQATTDMAEADGRQRAGVDEVVGVPGGVGDRAALGGRGDPHQRGVVGDLPEQRPARPRRHADVVEHLVDVLHGVADHRVCLLGLLHRLRGSPSLRPRLRQRSALRGNIPAVSLLLRILALVRSPSRSPRPAAVRRAARRALRRQQLGRHRRRRRPARFKLLARINIVPDLERAAAPRSRADPDRSATSSPSASSVGEGHDQYVDDMFTSHDGRLLYVSRPSLADVVAHRPADRGRSSGASKVEGYRADHMAISPDGTRLLVSASTGGKVHVIDTATGKIAGEFPSGDQPHENNYSRDGKLIFHASIGTVYTPADDPALDATQGRARLPDRRREHAARCSSASTWARSSRRPATRT